MKAVVERQGGPPPPRRSTLPANRGDGVSEMPGDMIQPLLIIAVVALVVAVTLLAVKRRGMRQVAR